ncbi:hypothetical protein K6U06_07850 [Acidiferrimicrobium sp. IK]|uniref:hypothetical protein n=1 Tax=Acidiferrimicrobium sp. IK TaxID=2871700 RepID=UPI0021CAFA6C|nr:hypothetical protein [Acidiferrimicrobium sp. IK]MCU4184271.1 hypothetical protein [Acidiferrimicrobium sp. IK]
MTAIPGELRALAERQYGLASVSQALGWLDRAAIRQLRAQGVVSAYRRNVIRFAGSSSSWRQQAMGACLAYGPPVAVSHLAAARLFGWDVAGRPPVSVVLPHQRSGRRGDLHAIRAALPHGDVVERFVIPVTSPVRTLVDLAVRLPTRSLEDLYDHLMRTAGLQAADVAARLPGRARLDGHSLYPLWRMTELRLERQAGGESVWEDRVAGWLTDAGLPAPARQHRVVLRGAVYRLDLAYPDQKVGVEFDGWEWHRSRKRFDDDRARLAELTLAGWLVVQVTSAHDRAETVGRVERALRQRGGPTPRSG